MAVMLIRHVEMLLNSVYLRLNSNKFYGVNLTPNILIASNSDKVSSTFGLLGGAFKNSIPLCNISLLSSPASATSSMASFLCQVYSIMKIKVHLWGISQSLSKCY